MVSNKTIYAWMLISVIFVHFVGTNIFYGIYVADNGLFTELFCENKFKPELHCHGSCVISKIFEYEKNDAVKSSTPHLSVPQFYTYFQQYDRISFDNRIIDIQHNYYYIHHYRAPSLSEIYHPPVLV